MNASAPSPLSAPQLRGFVQKLGRSGTRIYFASARPPVRRTLKNAGLNPPTIRYVASAAAALTQIKTGDP